jgi:hypothetical protein
MDHAQSAGGRSGVRLAIRALGAMVPAVLLWLPAGSAQAGASAIPPTVIRSVPLPLGVMVSGLPAGSVRVTLDGGVRPARTVTTATRLVCAPIVYTEVGVSWRQDGPATAAVSAFVRTAPSAAGPFTRGDRLDDATRDGGPGPGSPEFQPHVRATDPLWTGTGRCVRLSLRLPTDLTVSSARVVFLNTLGTAFGGPQVLTTLPMSGADASAGLSTRAGAPKPAIVTRTQWGADPNLINCFFGYSPGLRAAFVHHTATPNDYGPGQSAAIVRGIYA